MTITTKKEAKAAVSALRREIKALGKPPGQLSHADCLELLARSLGHANWNTWEALLDEDVPVSAPRYPLKNLNGQFDFVAPGEPGTPYSAWFMPLRGTYRQVFGCQFQKSATRSDGALEVDSDCSMTMDWESTTDVYDAEGHPCWVDSRWNQFPQRQVILLPVGYDEETDVYFDKTLPVRQALVEAYATYLRQDAIKATLDACKTLEALREAVLEPAEKLLGFKLTQKEVVAAINATVKAPA